MARLSATAAFLFLLSLLAVAHCRTLESEPDTAETTTVTVADETGPLSPTDVVPSQHEQGWFLRLPSHRRHRQHPCRHGLFHRHLWWARHHNGLFGDGPHRFHRRGNAELVIRDGETSKEVEAEEEVKPVAEPDPDRSLPEDSDGEDSGDDVAAVKRWRKEMLWRMFHHGLRHHRHHHHDRHEDENEEEGAAGVKRFRHHDEDHEEDEEKEKKLRKLFHLHHQHDHDEDEEKMRRPLHHDNDSDDELEEMVRRFRKAILRRRFHHGRFFRHGEEEQQQEGGVMTWIRGLMNPF